MNFSFKEIWIELKKFINNNLNIKNLKVNKKLIRLSFPEEHKDNLLLAGIFFHEVGHYLDRENQLAEKIYTQLDFDCIEFKSLNKYITNKQSGRKITQVNLIKIMNDFYLGPWLKEVISDSIAVYILGPAYIFSMMEFIITIYGNKLLTKGNLVDSFSYSHPSFYIRYNLLLKIIKDLDIKSVLPKEVWDKIKEYEKDWQNSNIQNNLTFRHINNNVTYIIKESINFFKDLEKVLKKTEAMIMKETKALLNDRIISKDILNTTYELADKRFKSILPPNEIDNKAVDSIAIINSGWYAKLLFKDDIIEGVGNINEANGEFDLNNLINNLLKYSLKTSRIQRRWQN